MEEIKLPSGAVLSVSLPDFETAKALYQAVAEEVRGLKVDANTEIDANFWKDLFLTFISSKKIEACLWKCMGQALYNGLKIDKDSFEKEDARDDYFMVCYEVGKKSILPFSKSLYAKYSHILGTLKNSLA